MVEVVRVVEVRVEVARLVEVVRVVPQQQQVAVVVASGRGQSERVAG